MPLSLGLQKESPKGSDAKDPPNIAFLGLIYDNEVSMHFIQQLRGNPAQRDPEPVRSDVIVFLQNRKEMWHWRRTDII